LAKIATKNAISSSATTKFFEIIPAKKPKLEIGILRLIGYKLIQTRTNFKNFWQGFLFKNLAKFSSQKFLRFSCGVLAGYSSKKI